MKRILVIALALLMLLSVTACQSSKNDAELEAMKIQMQLMQQQLNEAKQEGYEPSEDMQATEAPEASPEPETDEAVSVENVSGNLILALHSTIDGQTSLIVDDMTELTATADIPEGMAVDYWELNGDQYYEDMEDTFTFTTQGDTVVDARLRPERKVTAINAEMQFIDKKNKPKGDKFTEFVFEEEYENPVTNEMLSGGSITVNVKAVVPKGYAVDYWLINGMPYYYNRTVSSFTVQALSEATEYEVVLRKESAAAATPKPTAQPTQTPEVEAEPTYYEVSCTRCTFSGGGFSGAESGKVPAGTRITVTSNSPSAVYWEGSNGYGDKWHPEPNSFSYTVNSNCSFEACLIVN